MKQNIKQYLINLFAVFCVCLMSYALVIQAQEKIDKKENIAKANVMKIAKNTLNSK